MTAEEQELKELVGELALTDVLTAPKEKKEINFDYEAFERDKALDNAKKIKAEFQAKKQIKEAESIIGSSLNDDLEDIEEISDVRGDLELTSESALIIYELLIQFLNNWAAKRQSSKMSDDEIYTAAYLETLPKSDRSEEQNLLVGKYLHYQKEATKIIQDNELTEKDKELAKKALRTLFDKNGNPTQDNRLVTFKVSDNLRVLGVDNGSSTNPQDFKATKIVTDKGRALLIVQAKNVKGKGEILVQSEGMEDFVLSLDLVE